MTTSSIFKYANDISMNRSSPSARSVTTGGYARTHRLGPSLLSLDVNLPILSEEQYLEVENELFSIDDGIKFLTSNISSNNGNNIMSGVTTPLASGFTDIQFLTTDYTSLRTIVLCNLASNVEKIFKVGDFIQFSNHNKVYQISKPINESGSYFRSSSNGTCKVRLSTPLLSAIGYSGAASFGNVNTFYIVNGKADDLEDVTYDFNDGSFITPTPPSVFPTGIFTFVNAGTNTAYEYNDGTKAIVHIPPGLFTAIDIKDYLTACANGTASVSGPSGNISVSRAAQNNKLGQILSVVLSIGVTPNDILDFAFILPNIRVQLTQVSYTGATFTNETIITTITTPYQNGLITFKNSDNTTLKDRNGNDVTIVLPSYLQNALQIYNYINNTILATNSTHVLKTHDIVTEVSSSVPADFPENFGETDNDHVGHFSLKFGPEYGNLTMELTTPTGPTAVAFNPITKLRDVVQYIDFVNNTIEIDNPLETYNVGDYLQPVTKIVTQSQTQRISSVVFDPFLNKTIIDFDASFNTMNTDWSISAPSSGGQPNNLIQRHLNTATTTTTAGLIQLLNTYHPGSLSIASGTTTVKTGPNVNIKLMLTAKPSVTIIPKNETENLYKYNQFEFQEVL